jgi:hypothetical protein
VINLMDALRRSIERKAGGDEPKSAPKKASKAAGGKGKSAARKKPAPKKASAKRKTPRAA